MQIIKDKQIVDDSWSFVADDEELKDGDISVSLARWKKASNSCLSLTAR